MGAEVSVLPINKQGPPLSPSSISLEAANHSKIKTFGTCSVSLNLGLCRTFQWKFTEVDVKFPILGTDFLHHYRLLVDVSKSRLLDATSYLSTQGLKAQVFSINPITGPHLYIWSQRKTPESGDHLGRLSSID